MPQRTPSSQLDPQSRIQSPMSNQGKSRTNKNVLLSFENVACFCAGLLYSSNDNHLMCYVP